MMAACLLCGGWTTNTVGQSVYPCRRCKGTGVDPYHQVEPIEMGQMQYPHLKIMDCNVCGGTGVIRCPSFDALSSTIMPFPSPMTCLSCNGKGKVSMTIKELQGTPTTTQSQPGPKPTSREILTEILDQIIAASRDMTWFNFEDAAGNDRSKAIERQLWDLRGMLGDYVHALREEKGK